MLRLRFETGPRTGEYFPIDRDRMNFGRGNTSDCVLNHPIVSREHFYIERNAGKYFVVDHDSNNGTIVNGVRVSWVELKPGDQIQAGPFLLLVEAAEEAPGSRPAPAAQEAPAGLTETLERSTDTARLSGYPREYLEGLEHFNHGRYFEAHEIWEEIWLRSDGETKLFYQMLIQAAVGLHHYERGNLRGARGMYTAVTEKLARLPAWLMSLDLVQFGQEFKQFFSELIEANNENIPPEDRTRPRITLLSENSPSDML